MLTSCDMACSSYSFGLVKVVHLSMYTPYLPDSVQVRPLLSRPRASLSLRTRTCPPALPRRVIALLPCREGSHDRGHTLI